MAGGYVKLRRAILSQPWYDDANTARVYFHLLLMANFHETEFRGKKVMKGQIVISQSKIAESLGLTRAQVRVAIDKLVKAGDIAKNATSNSTSFKSGETQVYTIVSYDFYIGESPAFSPGLSPLPNKLIKASSGQSPRRQEDEAVGLERRASPEELKRRRNQ